MIWAGSSQNLHSPPKVFNHGFMIMWKNKWNLGILPFMKQCRTADNYKFNYYNTAKSIERDLFLALPSSKILFL